MLVLITISHDASLLPRSHSGKDKLLRITRCFLLLQFLLLSLRRVHKKRYYVSVCRDRIKSSET